MHANGLIRVWLVLMSWKVIFFDRHWLLSLIFHTLPNQHIDNVKGCMQNYQVVMWNLTFTLSKQCSDIGPVTPNHPPSYLHHSPATIYPQTDCCIDKLKGMNAKGFICDWHLIMSWKVIIFDKHWFSHISPTILNQHIVIKTNLKDSCKYQVMICHALNPDIKIFQVGATFQTLDPLLVVPPSTSSNLQTHFWTYKLKGCMTNIYDIFLL